MAQKVTFTKEEALDYHRLPIPGKISVETTKSFSSQKDLSLAYSPGVAHPCLEIEKNPNDAYIYTSKANLVAVISNGTAVLGLGDIGALASKPVMEGKAVLFKKFAAIDSFDIEVDEKDIDRFCQVVEAIGLTFGGINLEDIKAPECFEIERRLVEKLDIPVMHDDQHGTAIISAAGLMNACEVLGKDFAKIKVIISGAGASAISCARIYRELGVKNIIMMDRKGIIHKGRNDLNAYKAEFAIDEALSKNEAFSGADMVLGLSSPGSFDASHVALMGANPIVFSLANPTPEVFPEDVMGVRSDAIMATGRSDYPNQINNVLGFPFIFRGALDVNAKKINMQMKLAASRAIAELAKQEVPADVCEIYGESLSFGRSYIIPKPFDKRLIVEVSSAVAKSAFETGVARVDSYDHDAYRAKLQGMIC